MARVVIFKADTAINQHTITIYGASLKEKYSLHPGDDCFCAECSEDHLKYEIFPQPAPLTPRSFYSAWEQNKLSS